MLKRIFLIFLIILLCAAAAGFFVWMTFLKGYPWWFATAIILGILGLWIGIVFILRRLRRKKEEEFVRRVIVQDEEAIKAAPPEEKLHLAELQENWKTAVDLLRSSYLRKRGNPLYALPWFIIIGESGSGKTSAVKNTKLNSPLGDINPAGISVTRNCDWWFFDEAIILDTAGRYTIPIDEGRDREEWESFLTLLAKYRRREPVNGIIVTIAADKLREAGEGALADEGLSVRRRIDQLMRVLGAKIPVYVLVTKIDLIPGMLEFTNLLPRKDRTQAMGYVNADLDAGWERVLEESLSTVSARLRDLQFAIVHQGDTPEPEVFLFSQGFGRLRSGLSYFVRSVFTSNPYQATPPLRGLFFSSALQEGKAEREFTGLLDAGAEDEKEVVHTTGLFLTDLFRSILPRDRNLFIPLPEFLRARGSSRPIGLAAWIALWLCVTGVMGFSYLNARSALIAASSEASRSTVLTGRLSNDLLALERLRKTIHSVEAVNGRWFLPRMGFGDGRAAEEALKARFVRLYGDKVLHPFDSALAAGLDAAVADTLGPERLARFSCLVARIGLIREFTAGKDTESLAKFRDTADSILVSADPGLSPAVGALFGDFYLEWLRWNASPAEVNRQLADARAALVRQLGNPETLRRTALAWIDPSPDIRMSDFWGEIAENSYDEQVVIPGAFTQDSAKQLEDFFSIVEESAGDVKDITKDKQEFWTWYRSRTCDEWSAFALSFHREADGVDAASDGRRVISSMATMQNPYFDFLDRMAKELSGISKSTGQPSWVNLAVELGRVRELALLATEPGQPPTLRQRVANAKNAVLGSAVVKMDPSSAAKERARKNAARLWNEYVGMLEQLAPAVSGPETCFKSISDYTSNVSRQTSPFTVAANQVGRLQATLKVDDAPFIWDLVIGPQRFLVSYAALKAAGVLEAKWEEEVLGGIRGLDGDASAKKLFDEKEGLVWKFVNGTGKPFISRNQAGYSSPKDTEVRIPLKSEFFEFLNSGPKSVLMFDPSYTVTIETLPVEVNAAATVKPYGSTVSLQCAETRTVLENLNYPREQTFQWSPEACGDVTLGVMFPDFTATKTYGGKMGFAEFLKEFSTGSRTFSSDDFPKYKDTLDRMGVTSIRVSWKIKGARPVVRLLDRNPARVPLEIVATR